MRFTSWRSRTLVYRHRSKEGNVSFYIAETKRCFKLRKTAVDMVKDKPGVDFVFVDINCNLCIRFKKGAFQFFNSEEESFFSYYPKLIVWWCFLRSSLFVFFQWRYIFLPILSLLVRFSHFPTYILSLTQKRKILYSSTRFAFMTSCCNFVLYIFIYISYNII